MARGSKSGYNPLRRPERPEGALTLAECWAYVAARLMLRMVGVVLLSKGAARFSAT